MHYVYSTLTNSHAYTNWTRPADPNFKPEKIEDRKKGFPVVIQGGANLATSPESKRGRHTPAGVVTQITEEQLEYCRQNSTFLRHEKQGFLLVIDSKQDAEEVARDMTARDKVAPITPQSEIFQSEDGVKPLTTGLDRMKDSAVGIAQKVGGMFR